MTPRFGQRDEIIPIAGDQKTVVFVPELQDRGVGGFWWKHISDGQDFVIEFVEQVSEPPGCLKQNVTWDV